MKRCVILQIACAVIILSKVTFAKYYEKELLNLLKDYQELEKAGRPGNSRSGESQGSQEGLSEAGLPGTPRPEEKQDKCKKDILIILDTSKSVNEDNFNKEIKPFLRNLSSNENLNLGRSGTQVSLILFSKDSELVIEFKDKINKTSFKSYVDSLMWDDVRGEYTRTDKALKMADNEVFPEKSPNNNREYVSDVIILITDGKPYAENYQTVKATNKALEHAKNLKGKDIHIIGVGVGSNMGNSFKSILTNIASPGKVFTADFENLQSLKTMVVDASCEKIPPGQCTCPDVVSINYLKPGETSKKINWTRPDPQCRAGVNAVPSETAHNFSASLKQGEYEYRYEFFSSGCSEPRYCVVKIIVRACECPQKELGVVPVKPGETKVDLEWQVPVPTCLEECLPSLMTSQSLSVGQHSKAYTYNIGNQFNMTCQLNLKVRGALCNEKGYNQDSQECCCGMIHDKKTGYECCGQNHFNMETHQCCDGNIRKKDEECLTF